MTYKYNRKLSGTLNLLELWKATTGLDVIPTDFKTETAGVLSVTLPKVDGVLNYIFDRVPLDGVITKDITLRSVDVRLDDGLLNTDDVFRAIRRTTGVVIGEDDGVLVAHTDTGFALIAHDHAPFFKGEIPLTYIPPLSDRIESTIMLDWADGHCLRVEPQTLLLNTQVILDPSVCNTPELAGWAVEGTVNHLTSGKVGYFNTPNGTIQGRTRVTNDAFIEFDVRVPASAKNSLDLTRGTYAKLTPTVAAMFQVNGDSLCVVGSGEHVYSYDFTQRTRIGYGYDRTLNKLLLYINGRCVHVLPQHIDDTPVGTVIVGSFTEREQHFYVYGIKSGSKLPTGFPLLVEDTPYCMLDWAFGHTDAQRWSAKLPERSDAFLLAETITKRMEDGVGFGDFYYKVALEVESGEMGIVVTDGYLNCYPITIQPNGILVDGKLYSHDMTERTLVTGRTSRDLGIMELRINDRVVASGIKARDGSVRNCITIATVKGNQELYTVHTGNLSQGL